MIYINWKKSKKVNFDDSITFGRGVFETILVKEKPIMIEEHVKRLVKGAKVLNINNLLDIERLKTFIIDEKIKNCALKVILTNQNLIITTREVPYKEDDFNKGFKVTISSFKKNSTSRLGYIKSINYIENIIEREEALKKGFDEAIFLNENNFLSEGTISNIYLIKDKIIKTPKVECGLLEGTIRKWVIENFDVEESYITKEELLNSDGVFLTNSLMGVMKVTAIEEKVFKENNILNEIREKFLEFLEDF